MKELSGTARNFALAKQENNFRPFVEIVLMVSEPHYSFSVGEMVRERVPETIRFSTDRKGVKKLLETLKECDDEFELLEKEAMAAAYYDEIKEDISKKKLSENETDNKKQ